MTRRGAPLLQLKDIALTFGGTPLLSGAELSVGPGERVSLVGRNGTGKSTLLKIAAALVEPDRGSVFVQPGTVVRYLPQEPDLSGAASTLAYVEAGLRPSDDRHAALRLLEQLGLTGLEDPAKLSGGEARRACRRECWRPRYPPYLDDHHLDLATIVAGCDLDSTRCAGSSATIALRRLRTRSPTGQTAPRSWICLFEEWRGGAGGGGAISTARRKIVAGH